MNESDYQSVKKNRCVSSFVIWMDEDLATVDIFGKYPIIHKDVIIHPTGA